ncbi:unnamed protein product, partial [Protopolystoma xenopodis]
HSAFFPYNHFRSSAFRTSTCPEFSDVSSDINNGHYTNSSFPGVSENRVDKMPSDVNLPCSNAMLSAPVSPISIFRSSPMPFRDPNFDSSPFLLSPPVTSCSSSVPVESIAVSCRRPVLTSDEQGLSTLTASPWQPGQILELTVAREADMSEQIF